MGTKHLIIIGDSTKMTEVAGGSVHLVITSPPYFNAPFDYPDLFKSYKDFLGVLRSVAKQLKHKLAQGRIACFVTQDVRIKGRLYPVCADLIKVMLEAGFNYREKIIWRKPKGYIRISRRSGSVVKWRYPMYFYPDNIFEEILVFQNGKFDYKLIKEMPQELLKESQIDIQKFNEEEWFLSVWEITNVLPVPGRLEEGIAAFPEEIPRRLTLLYSFRGETVLDPFLGSGATSRVAMTLGRNSVGYEIDQELEPVIKQKLSQPPLEEGIEIKFIKREDVKSLRNFLQEKVSNRKSVTRRKKMNLVTKYPAETIQIYFPASLELQEELINNGFSVPKPTPIPIVYINFRGWIKSKPPVTIERLIEPSRYGVNPVDMNWISTALRGKQAYEIPPEESFTSFEMIGERKLKIGIHAIKYHLERTSIRGINPNKWNNWCMAYVSLQDAQDLRAKLSNAGVKPSISERPKKEVQQGGKEETFYLPVKVYDFKLCLGCFGYALEYLRSEAKRQSLDIDIAQLRLTLRKGEENTFLKAGTSQMEGKRLQFMMKLASFDQILIKGILKPTIEGKPRGFLELCNHTQGEQFIIVDASQFLAALNFPFAKQHKLDFNLP